MERSTAVPAARFDLGEPRESGDIVRTLRGRDDLLRRCYRWARFRDSLLVATRVYLTLEIDEWGRVTEFALGGGTRALQACVEDVLRGLELDRYTPRRTHGAGVISFSPSTLGRPRQAPSRPRAPPLRSQIPAVRVRQPITLPSDDLEFPPHPIDDYDEAQAAAEAQLRYRQALAAWRSGRGPRPHREPPSFVAACPVVCFCNLSNLDVIRNEIRRHLGKVAACYRAASSRRPGLQGRVIINAMLAATGQPLAPGGVAVRESTLDDRPLESCVAAALADLRLPVVPWSAGATSLSIPFRFIADDEPSGLPAMTPAPTRCTTQHAILNEAWVSSRRIDDEVMGRARDLAQTAAHDPRCLEAASELLQKVATSAHKDGFRRGRTDPVARAVPIYRLFLGLRPGDVTKRFYLAEALFRLERYGEAIPEYLLVAARAPGGKYFHEALDAASVAAREQWDGLLAVRSPDHGAD